MLKRSMMMLAFSILLSACVCQKQIENKLPNLYEQNLERQNMQLSMEVEILQQKLLSKQDEIKKLLLSQQQKTREVVRTKAKLLSHSSKAETVANIAEVRTVLKAVAGKTMNEDLQQVVWESEQMITLSIEALEKENIERAFELSNKAQQLIQPIRTLQGIDGFKNGSDVAFIAPLTMEVVTASNVRTGPGMNSAVDFILEGGTQIKALSYSKNWIQIEDESLGKGWVYYQLLEFVH